MMPVEMPIEFITDTVQQSIDSTNLLCDQIVIITILSTHTGDKRSGNNTNS
jgi:hypothetical protein